MNTLQIKYYEDSIEDIVGQIEMQNDKSVTLTFDLAFLCQCSYPLEKLTSVPTIYTAIQVIWLSNTSHFIIDDWDNPRIMDMIKFKKMIARYIIFMFILVSYILLIQPVSSL